MPWFKVDDNLAFHHKTVAAGVSAMGLWVRAGSWCAQTLTDGFVPEHMVPALADGDAGLAGRLVEAGLWRRVKGGFVFHEWAERQPSRQSIENLRTVRAAAGRNGGLKSGQVRGSKGSKPEASASSKPEASALQVLEPPARPDQTASEEANASSAPTCDDSPKAKITAGDVVAAWVDATTANGVKPTSSLKAQVGRTARELLQAGNDPGRVLVAAAQAGAKGYATIDRELTAIAARPRTHLRAVGSGTPCGDYWQD